MWMQDAVEPVPTDNKSGPRKRVPIPIPPKSFSKSVNPLDKDEPKPSTDNPRLDQALDRGRQQTNRGRGGRGGRNNNAEFRNPGQVCLNDWSTNILNPSLRNEVWFSVWGLSSDAGNFLDTRIQGIGLWEAMNIHVSIFYMLTRLHVMALVLWLLDASKTLNIWADATEPWQDFMFCFGNTTSCSTHDSHQCSAFIQYISEKAVQMWSRLANVKTCSLRSKSSILFQNLMIHLGLHFGVLLFLCWPSAWFRCPVYRCILHAVRT